MDKLSSHITMEVTIPKVFGQHDEHYSYALVELGERRILETSDLFSRAHIENVNEEWRKVGNNLNSYLELEPGAFWHLRLLQLHNQAKSKQMAEQKPVALCPFILVGLIAFVLGVVAHAVTQ